MREFIFLVTFSILLLCSAYAHLYSMGLYNVALVPEVIEGPVLVFKITRRY